MVFLALFAALFTVPAAAQQKKIDSLQTLLKADKKDTNKVNHLIALAKAFERTGNYPEAEKKVNEALELSNSIDFENGIAQSYHTMGGFYYNQGNFRKSKELFTSALEVRKGQGNKTAMAMLYNNIGQVNNQLGESGIALENFAEAVKLNKQTGDKHRLANNYCNIGVNYFARGESDKALENQLEAKRIKEELGENDDREYSVIVGNIALIYCDKGDFDQGLEMANVAVKISLELEDEVGIAGSFNTIGNAFYQKALSEKDTAKRALFYADAMNNFNQMLQSKDESESLEWAAVMHQGRAKVYMAQGKVAEAKNELIAGLSQAKESGLKDVTASIYGAIADCDSAMGNWKDAFANYKLSKLYLDSIFNEKNADKIAEMNARFETEKNKEKIDLLEKDKQRTRLFFGVFIALALVGLFFAWRAYSNKKKVAEFMASENHRKEVLLQEVNHRINNNLQIISSLLSLQANSADDQRLSEYLQQSQNRIQSLASLHELLFMNDASLKINMKEYLGKVLEYHKSILDTLEGKVDLHMNVDNDQFPPQIAVPVALIVNELVTNSLKYAFKGGKDGHLDVSLKRPENNSEKWTLRVSDSGNGLPSNDNFRKDSLGLRLVNLMTKQMKGVLTQSNSPGATFEIAFKLPA